MASTGRCCFALIVIVITCICLSRAKNDSAPDNGCLPSEPATAESHQLFSLINKSPFVQNNRIFLLNGSVPNGRGVKEDWQFHLAICSSAVPKKDDFKNVGLVGDRLGNLSHVQNSYKIGYFNTHADIERSRHEYLTITYNVEAGFTGVNATSLVHSTTTGNSTISGSINGTAASRHEILNAGDHVNNSTGLPCRVQITLICDLNATDSWAEFTSGQFTDELKTRIVPCSFKFEINLNASDARMFELQCRTPSQVGTTEGNITFSTTAKSVVKLPTAAAIPLSASSIPSVHATSFPLLAKHAVPGLSGLSLEHAHGEHSRHGSSRIGSFLMIFAMVLLVYFTSAIIYRRYVLHEQGRGQIPHVNCLLGTYSALRSPLVACYYHVHDWSRGRTHSILDDGDVIVAEEIPSRLVAGNVRDNHYAANGVANSGIRMPPTSIASAIAGNSNDPTVRSTRLQFVDESTAAADAGLFGDDEDLGVMSGNGLSREVYRRRDLA